MTSSYIRFHDHGVPGGMKTKVVSVFSVNSHLLGQIKWFGRWRQYCFFTTRGIVLSEGCMGDIAAKCREMTKGHKS